HSDDRGARDGSSRRNASSGTAGGLRWRGAWVYLSAWAFLLQSAGRAYIASKQRLTDRSSERGRVQRLQIKTRVRGSALIVGRSIIYITSFPIQLSNKPHPKAQ